MEAKNIALKHFVSKPLKLLMLSLLILVSQGQKAVQAEENSRAALLPWQLLGLDGEFAVRHRQSLDAFHRSLMSQWIGDAKPLDSWLAGRPLTLNQKRRSQTIMIGQSSLGLGFDAYIIPIICPLDTDLAFILQLVDLKSQLVLAGTQKLIARDAWEQRSAFLRGSLDSALASMVQELVVTSIRRQQNRPADAMKLSLRLLRGSQSSREGALQCQNILLTHSLIDQQRVLAATGNLEAALLREQLLIATPPQRASRILAIDWDRFPLGPDRWGYNARWVEGVLGSSIDEQVKGEVQLRRDPDRFEAPASLVTMLRQEKDQLRLSDLPRVSRIYKAWVYLDRGRAYGLDMDDRLTLEDGSGTVKGHVVGFFGPSAGVVSPRGFPVHEGAILYIRKGQRAVRLGDTFTFDPKTFPTPWPPSPPATGAKR